MTATTTSTPVLSAALVKDLTAAVNDLGYRLEWKVQQEVDLVQGESLVAIIRLHPTTPRARAGLVGQGPEGKDAEYIEAEQHFHDPADVTFAVADAARAAVVLAGGVG